MIFFGRFPAGRALQGFANARIFAFEKKLIKNRVKKHEKSRILAAKSEVGLITLNKHSCYVVPKKNPFSLHLLELE